MAYCAYITRIKNLVPVPNSDNLMKGECLHNNVVVSKEYHDNQLGIFFPVDGQLSEEFCAANNLVRKKDENGNDCGGYLDPDKRRITAIKLRGERSEGLFLPLTSLANFYKISDLKEGDAVSMLNGHEICCKYIPKKTKAYAPKDINKQRAKANFAPTFYEHVDTQQLTYNLGKFKAGDVVELTLKMHGTSGRTGYLPLIRDNKPTFLDKLLRRPPKQHKEYGYVTGTRRVILKEQTSENDYYGTDAFRRAMAKKFEGKLRKGEVVYYEIVGFVNASTPIMPSADNTKVKDKDFVKQYGKQTVFSYGCDPTRNYEATEDTPPMCDVYVYRMTMVNEDGDVTEYSPDQMRERCEQMAVKTVPVFERFIIPKSKQTIKEDERGYYIEEDNSLIVDPGEYVLRKVEEYYDGPDPIGKTHVREGVVARIVSSPAFTAYKHKNFAFRVLSGIAVEQAEKSGATESMDEDILSEL